MLNKQHELRDGKCPLKATIHCIATLDFGLMGRHGLHYLGANYYPFANHLLLIKTELFSKRTCLILSITRTSYISPEATNNQQQNKQHNQQVEKINSCDRERETNKQP